MLEFDSTHIIVGQIKQLLANFQLPSYKIYTREDLAYYNTYGKEPINIIESVPIPDTTNLAWQNNNTMAATIPEHVRYIEYIKDNKIQRYYKDKNSTVPYWHDTGVYYSYNKPILNKTKSLQIKNNIYDRYTHEYLGDYLRFLRDYNGLDLMPLYNCFSNTIVTHLNYTDVGFNTDDEAFKIYMLPVKTFKTYTIAIDCQTGIEMCCGVYGKYQNKSDKLAEIPAITYHKQNCTNFGSPFIYNGLLAINNELSADAVSELANIEKDLKLFIKVPANNTSTIVVLEGDYLNWNDSVVVGSGTSQTDIMQNNAVINFEVDNDIILNKAHPNMEQRQIKFISALQLLQANTNKQCALADRLLEFISGNIITALDDITDNIKRIQTILVENGNTDISIDGIWTQKLQAMLYEYIYLDYTRNKVFLRDKVDILGLGDKVVEEHLNSQVTRNKVTTTINTLRDINLYENAFRNTYKGGNR